MPSVDDLILAGDIGGRTVQIVSSGDVECTQYEPRELADGEVRIQTVTSAVSPGTEMTYYGRNATNVYLNKTWNPALRLFERGPSAGSYPVTFGYRAAGRVVETKHPDVALSTRIYGSWRHTEFVTMPGGRAQLQFLPDDLSWDDGVDIAHMGPICVNAVAFGDGGQRGQPVVVFGAGPVGLIVAQILKAKGASRVYVVDRLESRLAIARGLGLDTLIADDDGAARELKRLHGSEAFPVVWECTGSTAALHDAIRVVRRQGAVIAVGFYQGDARGLYLGEEFHHNGVRIVSGQIGNIHPTMDMASLRKETLELVRRGNLVLGRLPRLAIAVEDVAQGFRSLSRPSAVLQVALTY